MRFENILIGKLKCLEINPKIFFFYFNIQFLNCRINFIDDKKIIRNYKKLNPHYL